jgi:hypothetical protein
VFLGNSKKIVREEQIRFYQFFQSNYSCAHLPALGDHKPKSLRKVVEAAYTVLASCWRKGLVLRTKEAIYEFEAFAQSCINY